MKTTNAPARQADLAYAITYAGAIGSAVVASLFLILDTVAGRPLETPILMGSALFLGELPAASGPLRLDLAAAYSLVHLVSFTAVGALFAVVTYRLQELPFFATIAGLFLALSAGLLTLDALVAPDLAAAIGSTPILLGNLLAAGAMTAFYARAFDLGAAWATIPTTLIGDSQR